MPLCLVWLAAAVGLGALGGGSGLAGATGCRPGDQALAVFRPLHANIYRAFDYTAESDVYDALARSVRGDLLDELYNEVYRGLVMQEQGGAVSRVRAVRPLATEVLEVARLGPGGEAASRWTRAGRWTARSSTGDTPTRAPTSTARGYTVLAGGEGWAHRRQPHPRADARRVSPGSGERRS